MKSDAMWAERWVEEKKEEKEKREVECEGSEYSFLLSCLEWGEKRGRENART